MSEYRYSARAKDEIDYDQNIVDVESKIKRAYNDIKLENEEAKHLKQRDVWQFREICKNKEILKSRINNLEEQRRL